MSSILSASASLILAPDALRATMEEFFDKIRQSVVEFNQKMDATGAQIQQAASAAGVEVKMKHISEAGVPSLDDIQNLQMMIRIPEVACSTEMRQIIEPMIANPPLRLVLDLMNLPTTPEDVEETCGGVSKSLTESAAEFVKPEITLPEIPAMPQVPAMMPQMPQMPAMMPQMPAMMPQMPAMMPQMPQMPQTAFYYNPGFLCYDSLRKVPISSVWKVPISSVWKVPISSVTNSSAK